MNAPRPIRLYIERLVLDGVPCASADGSAVEAALGAELALYAREHIPPQLRDGSFAKLDAPAIDLAANSGPQLLGRQIARSLMAGLPRTTVAAGSPAVASGSARHPSVTSSQHQTHEGVTT